MENNKYNDLRNMCRTCMFTSKLKPLELEDNNIIQVLYKLTGIHYPKTDELPQQICEKCIQKMNEVYSFALQCKQTYLNLTEYLFKYKNNQSTISINETIHRDNINKMNEVEYVQIKQEPVQDSDDEDLSDNVKIEEVLLEDTRPNAVYEDKNINNKLDSCSETESDINELHIKSEPSDSSNFIEIKNLNDLTYNENTTINNDPLNDYNEGTSSKIQKNIEEIFMKQDKTEARNDEGPNKCDVCSKAFKFSGDLIKHKRIHSGERPYQCDICNKTFTQSGSLIIHKRRHGDERPYQCDICFKGFKVLNSLKGHKIVHSSERPFKCDLCVLTFKRSYGLNLHKKTHHSREYPPQCHPCDICLKTFNRPYLLKEHKISHSGERPYQCKVCKKDFNRLDTLNRHKRLYCRERPFHCDECNETFKSLNGLNVHKKIHNVQCPLQCKVCNQEFVQLSHLKKHMKIHEQNETVVANVGFDNNTELEEIARSDATKIANTVCESNTYFEEFESKIHIMKFE